MSNVIVKYHNDLNKIQLPSFTEQEQNMLFSILAKVKDAENGKIRLFTEDILTNKVESSEYFTAVMDSLKNKFFKASFRQIVETRTEIIDSHFHLFNTMDIHYQKKDPNDMHDNSKIFCYMDLQVNPRFAYLINELTANFTRFELTEFISLSGKYTKTLYRLLKQYRNTGYMRTEWREFMRIMDIPYTRQTDIDQFILKPALKELTKPRNLFDIERVPFKNLSYKKIKKGGNKISEIEFRFDIDNLEELESNPQTDNLKLELRKAKNNYFSKDSEWLFINNVIFADSQITLNLYNKDSNKTFNRTYALEEWEKELKPFIVGGAGNKIF
ncbi:replication initiation protein (plasmid) [Helicobacter cinaedi]|uniref:replication initiation protein n=1 Tax=Helicobacter cinaedi TaxID=213 RepID=UPI001F24E77A|nr:replication initiation protein [Helicobacter cinaedi]BDB65810.1 replication initiation protein [Helicobacter cinaedi]